LGDDSQQYDSQQYDSRPPALGGSPDETPLRSPAKTLQLVLRSPEHKPQRVAAAFVCVAATIVIFVFGRSPIAGTESIGQATGALSAGPQDAPLAKESAPILADPAAADKELKKLGEADALSDPLSEPQPALVGDELAPGLVVPPEPGSINNAKDDKTEAVGSPSTTAKATSANAPVSASPARAPQRPAKRRQPKPAKKRRRSSDFDFGI
jgi:hypothetical protein